MLLLPAAVFLRICTLSDKVIIMGVFSFKVKCVSAVNLCAITAYYKSPYFLPKIVFILIYNA